MFSLYITIEEAATKSCEKHFNLVSLQRDFIETLGKSFELYDTCRQIFFDGQHTPPEDYEAQLSYIRSLPATEAFPKLKQLTHKLRQAQQTHQNQQWREEETRCLAEGQLFSTLQDAANTSYAKAQLQILEKRWKYQGCFIHFEDEALLKAHHYLSYIRQKIAFALAELKSRFESANLFKDKIPQAKYDSYKHYLKNTLQTIYEEQQRITASMYERLRIAAYEQDLTAGDVLIHTIKRLKQMHLVKQEYSSAKKQERRLTSEVFNEFHQVVLEQGSQEIKRKTLDLPWFSVTKSNTTALNASSLKLGIAVQFDLEKKIPKQLKKPTWLFKGTAIRYEFFAKPYDWASLTVARERLSLLSEGDLDEDSLDAIYFDLVTMENGFKLLQKNAKTKYKEITGIFRRYFTKKTQQFLKAYQENLLELKKIEQRKLQTYLQRMTESIIKGLLVPGKDLDGKLKAMEKLKFSQTSELRKSFKLVRHTLKIITEQKRHEQEKPRRIAEVKALLEPLKNQTVTAPASMEAVNAVLDYHADLSPSLDEVTELYEKCMLDIILHAKANFILPSLVEDMDEERLSMLELHYKYLENQGRLLKGIGDTYARDHVNSILEDLIFQYLGLWITDDYGLPDPMEHKHALSEMQESLLLSLGNESIGRLITQCQRFRKEENYEDLDVLCRRHLKQGERQAINRYLSKHFKALEESLCQYLLSQDYLKLSSVHIEHVLSLCTRMVGARVNDVKLLPGLTSADVTHLGLHNLTVVEKLFGNQRELIRRVINIIAKLRMTQMNLPFVTNTQQRQQQLHALKEDILLEVEACGASSLKELIQEQKFFDIKTGDLVHTSTLLKL